MAEMARASVSVRPRAHRLSARWVAPLVGAASLLVFTAMQLHVERTAISGGEPSNLQYLDWPLTRYVLAGDVSRYLGLAGAGVLLVLRGRRGTFWLPALAYMGGPLLFGWNDPDCNIFGMLPAGVGGGWGPGVWGCPAAQAVGWGPAAIQAALVVAPAVALVLTHRSSGREGQAGPAGARPAPVTALTVGCFLLAVFATWGLLWAWALTDFLPGSWTGLLPGVLPLFVFGALIGTFELRWSWSLLAVPVFLSTGWLTIPLNSTTVWQDFVFSLASTVQFVVVPPIAAGWKPLSSALHRLQKRPLAALLTVNAMNVADALFTQYGLRAEGAVEANPLVRAIGLPAKILLVAALSVLLLRVRPRALVWVVLAFCGVIVWHVTGYFASPH